MYEVTITWTDGSSNSENFDDLVRAFGWTLSMLASSGHPALSELSIQVIA